MQFKMAAEKIKPNISLFAKASLCDIISKGNCKRVQ